MQQCDGVTSTKDLCISCSPFDAFGAMGGNWIDSEREDVVCGHANGYLQHMQTFPFSQLQGLSRNSKDSGPHPKEEVSVTRLGEVCVACRLAGGSAEASEQRFVLFLQSQRVCLPVRSLRSRHS